MRKRAHLDVVKGGVNNAGHLETRSVASNSPGGQRGQTRSTMAFELVSETVDQTVDVDRLYDLVAALLVRRYRAGRLGAVVAEAS